MPRFSTPILDAQGNVIGRACGRTPHRECSTPGCANHATIQCDFPVTRGGKPGTCDRWCCRGCAVSIGPDLDHCPAHARASGGAPGAALPEQPSELSPVSTLDETEPPPTVRTVCCGVFKGCTVRF